MQRERDYLIKHVGPQLRTLCESRGLAWSEVDLRWGVDEEDSDDILALCLEEVERCRPCFIGLLGERYAHVVENIADDVIERHPWLSDHRYKSITELEVIHGVFHGEKTRQHTFLYFRDPRYFEQVPSEERQNFISEAPELSEKLKELKVRIREAHNQNICRLREPYHSPHELGQWILEDFTQLINELLPAEQKLNPALGVHLHYAVQRRRFWVGRQTEMEHLNEMADANRAVLVTGNRGVGLSAFLANWTAAWREAHPETLIVEHYVGTHPDATTLNGCCRQLCLALAAAQGLPEPAAAVERDWPDLFIEHLAATGAVKPVLLVIDGADHLHGPGAEAGADWLPGAVPEDLPDGVKIVASAGENEATLAEWRCWPALSLRGLLTGTRGDFVVRYLSMFGKKLSQELVELIASAPAAENPFYLTLLLEELRQHGDNQTVADRLAELLDAHDVAQLCNLIFSRCERDYETAFPGLTGAALGLIATAQFGLSEDELCEVIGGRERLPQRAWSPIRLALDRLLVSRDGVLGFTQEAGRDAAIKRYAPTAERQRALHRQLADYFLSRPASLRAAAELPLHLSKLRSMDELADWLSLPEVFETAWHLAADETCRMWSEIEKSSSRRAWQAYGNLPPALNWPMLNLLRQLGHWAEALVVARIIEEHLTATGCSASQLQILLAIGQLKLESGLHRDAEKTFERAEKCAMDLPDCRMLVLAIRGRVLALSLLVAGRRRGWERREILRRRRILEDRAVAIARDSNDPTLEAELDAAVLEETLGRNMTLQRAIWLADGLRGMLLRGASKPTVRGSSPAQRLTNEINRVEKGMHDRVAHLKDVVAKLRFTRHRSLALRAALTVARMEEDSCATWAATENLRQYAASRGDLGLLATCYEGAARLSKGRKRLRHLRYQATMLKRAGNHDALARCWWQQAETYWPELAQRRRARALLRRAVRAKPHLPQRTDRVLFRVYRMRLLLNLDEKRLDRFLRAGVWILSPFWIWFVWVGARLATKSLSSVAGIELAAYATAFCLTIVPAMALLFEGLDGAKCILRKLRTTQQRSNVKPSSHPAREPSRVAVGMTPGKEWSPQRHGVSSTVTICKDQSLSDPVRRQEPASARAGSPGDDEPAWVARFILLLLGMARSHSRIQRVGLRLGLGRMRSRLAWCALAVPCGTVLALWFWHSKGLTRVCLSPFGLAGQILVIESVACLFLPALLRRVAQRFPFLPAKTGSLMSFACMLALIRLKRRLFGRRATPASRAKRVGSHIVF
jgi:hypothetical protein